MAAKAICHVVILCQAEIVDTEAGVSIKLGRPQITSNSIIGKLSPDLKFNELEIHKLLEHSTIQNAAMEVKPPEGTSLNKVVEHGGEKPEGPVN